jgi:hypothetical protein
MNNTSYSYKIACPHPECRRAICLECYSHHTVHFPTDEVGFSYAARVCSSFCPACGKLITVKQEGLVSEGDPGDNGFSAKSVTKIIDPPEPARLVSAPEIPEKLRSVFNEAAAVLALSPKASAALSRRLLQQVLRDTFHLKHQDLSKEIEEFINRPGVPTELRDAIDAIRNIGNFAAHPNKDKNTGDICDVESGEAEWCLDVLESLFDYGYIQPARMATKKAQLNAKLLAAGKPPIKP